MHGALPPVGAEGAGRSGGGLGELAEALACPFPAQSPLRLAGRRNRPRARRIHRVAEALPCSVSASESGAKGPAEGWESSARLSPALSLLPLSLRERGEGTDRGIGEFAEALACPLPCSVSASETWAKRPAEGSENSPRPSARPPSCSVGEREEKKLEVGPFARSEGLAAASRSSDVPSAVSGVTADARSYSMEQFGQRQSSELLGLHRSHLGRNDV